MKLNLSKYDAIAFDFDGTLANTFPTHRKSRIAAFESVGITDISVADHALGHTYGPNPTEIIAGVLKAADKIDKDADPYTHPLVAQIVNAKRENFKKYILEDALPEQPGAVTFLKTVADHFRDKTMIVTTAIYSEVAHFLERYELIDYFLREQIISEEDVYEKGLRLKPEPDAYTMAAEVMKVHPSSLLVFEDSVGGVAAAKQAGATVVMVGYIHGLEEFEAVPKELHPDYFVNSFEEIVLE